MSQDKDYSADFEGLVDVIKDPNGNPAFLVQQENELVILDSIMINGKTFYPPEKDQFPYELPRGSEVIKHYKHQNLLSEKEANNEVFRSVLSRFKDTSVLPGEVYYLLLTFWVIATYFSKKFTYFLYVFLYALPGRGKTRTLKAVAFMGFRGIFTESLREANFLRFSDSLNATVCVDVVDVMGKTSALGSHDNLISRFENGSKTGRVFTPGAGKFKEMKFFDLYGPTALATNEPITGPLLTRGISINMPFSEQDFQNEITASGLLDIKEQLTALRARYLNTDMPAVSKPARGRIGDYMRSLFSVAELIYPAGKEALENIVKIQEEEMLLSTADSIEVKVINAINSSFYNVNKGILPVKAITERINEDQDKRFNFSTQRVGHVLAAMGFQKGRTSNGASAILWHQEQIEKMKKQYGIGDPSTPNSTSNNDSSQGAI